MWEEVWDLPNSAALSSWLLLIITAGAMVGSWFFERRIWCRHAFHSLLGCRGAFVLLLLLLFITGGLRPWQLDL